MGWTSNHLPSKIYYNPNIKGYDYLKKYYIQFEINTDNSNPTSVLCRAKFGHDDWGTGSGKDYFYLYFPNLNGSSKSFLLHNGGSGTSSSYDKQRIIPAYTASFYLKKAWNDDYFTLPECYIFCQGREGRLGTFSIDLFNDGRKNWKYKISANPSFYNGYTPGSISSPTLTILDNGDNTANLSGTSPDTVTPSSVYPFPNYIKSSYLWYTTDSRYEPGIDKDHRETISLKPGDFSYNVSRIDDSNTDITQFEVDGYIETTPKYGGVKKADVNGVRIKYWKAPSNQLEPSIQPMKDNKNISKIIPKCILRCQWDMAEVGNDNSRELKYNGCRFYFLIKRKGTSTWEDYGESEGDNGWKYVDIYYEDKTTPLFIDKNTPGFVCYKNPDSNSFYIDVDSETYNLQNGDKVKIGIQPWTTNITRLGTRYYWKGISSYSEGISVGSAGIINIKQSDNSWNEGQVYIKTVDGWIEADSVYIKDNSGWKESI